MTRKIQMAVSNLDAAVVLLCRELRGFKLAAFLSLLIFLAFGVGAVFAQSSGTSVIFAQLFTGESATGRSKVFVDVRNQGITNHVVQWTVTGSPTTCTLVIEKSEDAVSWSTVSTETCTANGSKTLADSSYIFLTANLTALSGGTSPTVSSTYRGYLPGQGIPVRTTEGGTGTTTAFTVGSLVFAGTSGVYAQDNSNFYVDNTNNRLCVGTSGATNCTQMLSIGAGKMLVTSAGLATIKGGAVVNTDGGGLTRAQQIEITDAATTKGLQIEAYAAQTANLFEALRDGGTVVRTQISKDGAIGTAIDTATVSGTTQIDGNGANNHKITLTEDTTLSVVTTGMLAGQHLRLIFCQDATGGRKVTWPSSSSTPSSWGRSRAPARRRSGSTTARTFSALLCRPMSGAQPTRSPRRT